MTLKEAIEAAHTAEHRYNIAQVIGTATPRDMARLGETLEETRTLLGAMLRALSEHYVA